MDPAFIKQMIDLGSFAVLAVLVLLTFFLAVPRIMKEIKDMREGFSKDLREQREEFVRELSEQRLLFYRSQERMADAISSLKDLIIVQQANCKKD